MSVAAPGGPPSPNVLLVDPPTVVMLYVGCPRRIPVNPAIKNELTSSFFTTVSLLNRDPNTANTVGYSFSAGKGSKKPDVTVNRGRPLQSLRVGSERPH